MAIRSRSISLQAGLLGSVMLLVLPGCGGEGDSSPASYTVGGTITGLNGVLLLSNGSEQISRSMPGAFSFPGKLADNTNYTVTIAAQPASQTCTLQNASGTIHGSDITNVLVTCTSGAATGSSVVQVSTGTDHTCAVLQSGKAKCWGNGFNGLGLGDTLLRGDQPGEMGVNLPAVDLGTGRTAKQVVASHLHSCAILDNGSVKCWGSNVAGRLGLGDTRDRGKQPNEMGDQLPDVDLGTGRSALRMVSLWDHTCALLDNGTVKCWGVNSGGELGLGDTRDRGDDAGEMGDNLPAIDFGTGLTAVDIAVGYGHSCAILDTGAVKCWGSASRLGRETPAADTIGDDPNEMGDALVAVSLGTGRTAIRIAAGYNFSCALLDNASVKCWGDNGYGQLGLGDILSRGGLPGQMGDNLPAVDLGSGAQAVEIAAGDDHVCARLSTGGIKCWGRSEVIAPVLGLGSPDNRGDGPDEMGDMLPFVNVGDASPVAHLASKMGRNSCVVFVDGSLKCWGGNYYGSLGLGDSLPRGGNPGEMGNNLPAVDVGM